MSKSRLVVDAENMEEITERLAKRDDIWQDRYVYWIAVAVLHAIDEIRKIKRKIEE